MKYFLLIWILLKWVKKNVCEEGNCIYSTFNLISHYFCCWNVLYSYSGDYFVKGWKWLVLLWYKGYAFSSLINIFDRKYILKNTLPSSMSFYTNNQNLALLHNKNIYPLSFYIVKHNYKIPSYFNFIVSTEHFVQ